MLFPAYNFDADYYSNRSTNTIIGDETYQKEVDREINICDLFGGSGIRGIRYKKEIDGCGQVNINDISSLANKFTKINAKNNRCI